MKRNGTLIALIPILMMLAALLACGGASQESGAPGPVRLAGPPGPPGPFELPGLPGNPGNPGNPSAAAPARAMDEATPAPAAAAVTVEQETARSARSAESPQTKFSEERVALVAQNRIIVRTVNMDMEVLDVAEAIELISVNAQSLGGWVVSSDRSSRHYGFIAVRVPATELDAAMQWMRQVGVDVLSEASSSADVTDEYYDLRSRAKSLQATEEALIKLLDRAEKVEDALEVQRELARLQVEIEAHLGRIKMLEETAAFSLVNISLNVAPQDMRVDAGEDMTFSVGESARFRAIFYPPEGIDEFDFTWDFGDGSELAYGGSSAPRADGGRITATVHHQYISDLESPFIVEVTMTGWGEAGIVEGSDTFIATVTRIPAIEVFAGEHRFVEAGEEVNYSGSFTRPKGLTNYQYTWEFNDGTPAVSGTPEEGATSVDTLHVFDNHRPQSYTATLTASAESAAGKVEGSASSEVFVQESQGFVISGWSAGDDLKSAVRALSGVAQAAGTVLIWVVTFSPVWLAIGVVIYVFVRFRHRLIESSRRRAPSESGVDESYLSTTRDGDAEEQN